MSRILLSGIPGGGKTTTGEMIATKYGYAHIDMEKDDFANAKRILADPATFISQLPNDQLVLSWGFGPLEGKAAVRALSEAGFNLIWFDGPHEHFVKRFLIREDRNHIKAVDLYGQLSGIILTGIRESLPWTVINPFDDEGEFIQDISHVVMNCIINS